MSCIAQVTQKLRERGFRITPQRLTVLEILHDGGHLTPSDVYERSREVMPGMTEATIYRTLEFLTENGIIFAACPESGRLAYELSGQSHHHLNCRTCGTQIEVSPSLFTSAIGNVEKETGYRLEVGHLTFSGICPACRNAGTG